MPNVKLDDVTSATIIADSMEPQLKNDDQIVFNNPYYQKDPERFDLIIFRENSKKEAYFKRIIGLPGEFVELTADGQILINNKPLEERTDLIKGEISKKTLGNVEYPIKLGEGEYFVLSDNRNRINDSRSKEIGKVKKSEIIGQVYSRSTPTDASSELE